MTNVWKLCSRKTNKKVTWDVLKTETTPSTSFDKIPGTSIEFTSGIRPYLETRPYVGLYPIIPQYEAGFRTDPPVSDPMALQQ